MARRPLMTRLLTAIGLILLPSLALPMRAQAQHLLVPMDDAQRNHLKAYGLAFQALKTSLKVEWLLNYRGGAFLLPDDATLRRRAALDGVSVEPTTDAGVASWYDFAVAIRDEAAALGFATARTRVTPIRTVDYPTPARRPAMSLLSKDATWALLGRPAPHWREALRATLAESSAANQAAAATQSTTGAR